MTNKKGIIYRLIQLRTHDKLIEYCLLFKQHGLISLQLGKMNVINIALLRGK